MPPPHLPVVWSYQDEATSTKLAQMVENTRTHDHRADGSQGAALVGEWVTATAAAAAGGWDVTAKRYRLLLGGALVQLDVVANRTGSDLTASNDGQINPGNLPDTEVLTGLPVEARPSLPVFFAADTGLGLVMVRATAEGALEVVSATTSGGVKTGQSLQMRPVLWR